jgi:hypothetical protein
MERIIVDFNKTVGQVKPVNSVNNGPVAPDVRGNSNFEYYKDAKIPFARLHDSAFFQ